MAQSIPSARERDFLNGQLLIAMPNMGDPRFDQSVILLCAHNADHAMGLVLNKPISGLKIGTVLEQLEFEADGPYADLPVYAGGPVDKERGFILHSLDYKTPDTAIVTKDIGLTTSKAILQNLAGANARGPKYAMLALGYAGWGAGQLEDEIQANAWAHCAPSIDLVFDAAADGQWRAAFNSLGVTEAMFSSEWAETRPPEGPLH